METGLVGSDGLMGACPWRSSAATPTQAHAPRARPPPTPVGTASPPPDAPTDCDAERRRPATRTAWFGAVSAMGVTVPRWLCIPAQNRQIQEQKFCPGAPCVATQ